MEIRFPITGFVFFLNCANHYKKILDPFARTPLISQKLTITETGLLGFVS
jgi:hypothetical protein